MLFYFTLAVSLSSGANRQEEVDRRETGGTIKVALRSFRSSYTGFASLLWRTPIRLGLPEGAMAMPVTRYAKSGDVHIAYQVFGSGPIDLVFVPGFVSHIENYWDQPDLARWLLRLSSFARVAIFDKRGTGLSDRVAEAPSLDQRMDDARAVMDAVGMERAALLEYRKAAHWRPCLPQPIRNDAKRWCSTAPLHVPPGLPPRAWRLFSNISIKPGAAAAVCRCGRRRIGTIRP